MIRRYSGRADLHLRRNNAIIDRSLTYTKTTQWQDASVYWVGSIAKGSHTFSITGNRANAFGCGSNWGDLDIIVIPKLKGVNAYQFGVTQSGCPANNLNFKKTITLAQDSVVWATGHIISKNKNVRADLYLEIDGKRRDQALAYDVSDQWVDQNVHHAITLKKGKHTFQLSGNSGSKFGCGTGWGDLDIVVVPKMKGVAGYNQPDTKSGCPKSRKANSNLIAKTITLTQTSIVKVVGHMIRNYNGRADLYLYRGNARLDLSLSYTAGKMWADVQLHHVGRLGKGKYTFSIRSNRANAFGCGSTWGDLDILVLPETVSASKPPAKGDKNLSGGNSGGAKNLKACTGECDADSQCAKGLKCFQRSKGEKIPGCTGNGGGKDWDYCYNPLHGGVKELGGSNDSKAKNLQRCVGECDADSQCAYGLKCFQRSKGEKIPGCKDGKKKMPGHYDYCYDPKTEVKKPNPCLKNNGGCDKARKCTNSNGKAKCGNCPKGYTNLGATKCKKAPTSNDKKLSGGNSGGAKNLKACTGECDADSQCAKGLKCFQRSKGEKIPGCTGNGGGRDWDYCYNPLHGG